MESHASLKFARVSARKARLVADLVRGRAVPDAIRTLTFLDQKSAPLIRKLVESAIANAEQKSEDVDVDKLVIRVITVDSGPSLRRFRPRAQGRATKVLKKTSHITVQLANE